MYKYVKFLFILLTIMLSSCLQERVFIAPNAQISHLSRVVVLPFEDLSLQGSSSRILTANFSTELRKQAPFRVVDFESIPKKIDSDSTSNISTENFESFFNRAKKTGADALVTGTVTEYRYKRGLGEEPVLGLNVRLVSLSTGAVLWNASISANSGFFRLSEASLNELSQEASESLVRSMFKK